MRPAEVRGLDSEGYQPSARRRRRRRRRRWRDLGRIAVPRHASYQETASDQADPSGGVPFRVEALNELDADSASAKVVPLAIEPLELGSLMRAEKRKAAALPQSHATPPVAVVPSTSTCWTDFGSVPTSRNRNDFAEAAVVSRTAAQ